MWGKKKKNLNAIFSYSLTVAAPDLLDPKSATHNTKPRLSFSTKPITLTSREESEVRETKNLINELIFHSFSGGGSSPPSSLLRY